MKQVHPMTISVLATTLQAHPKAVGAHVLRLLASGYLTKIGRGLYDVNNSTVKNGKEVPYEFKNDLYRLHKAIPKGSSVAKTEDISCTTNATLQD